MPTSYRMRVDCLGLDLAECAREIGGEALRHGWIVTSPNGNILSVLGWPTSVEYEDGRVFVTWGLIDTPEAAPWKREIDLDPTGFHLAVVASVKRDVEGKIDRFWIRELSVHRGVLE